MRFRAPPPGVLRQVRLDSMTAVFDRRTGQTHIVAEIVATILEELGVEDAQLDALASRVLGASVPEADREALAERLHELVIIGLVEVV